MNDYHINVFNSEDDGGYIADIPDLEAAAATPTTPAPAATPEPDGTLGIVVRASGHPSWWPGHLRLGVLRRGKPNLDL